MTAVLANHRRHIPAGGPRFLDARDDTSRTCCPVPVAAATATLNPTSLTGFNLNMNTWSYRHAAAVDRVALCLLNRASLALSSPFLLPLLLSSSPLGSAQHDGSSGHRHHELKVHPRRRVWHPVKDPGASHPTQDGRVGCWRVVRVIQPRLRHTPFLNLTLTPPRVSILTRRGVCDRVVRVSQGTSTAASSLWGQYFADRMLKGPGAGGARRASPALRCTPAPPFSTAPAVAHPPIPMLTHKPRFVLALAHLPSVHNTRP